MGLSGPVAASDVVAELAPDDLLDGHRDQRCHEVERVAVVGLYEVMKERRRQRQRQTLPAAVQQLVLLAGGAANVPSSVLLAA